MKKQKIIVSVTNDLVTDNRVDKVCLFLLREGFEVLLVGRKLKSSAALNQRPYNTKRLTLLFTKGALFYAEYNLRLFFLLLFRSASHQLSNDLDTLLANYLAAKMRKRQLVYDSHELYTEVPELIHRPRIKRIWERIEAWIFPKLNSIYTVNDSIAEFYSTKYNKKVHVVRNVSPKWQTVLVPLKTDLGIPEGKQLLIVQGAGINIDRGIEELIEAMPKINENCVLLIVGAGDVLEQIKSRVAELKIQGRVLFFGKRPYYEMMAFTHHADWGISLDKDTNMNYRFSLPNKIFDYIHAKTPIICSDLPEIRKIVHAHQVGVFIPAHEPTILANFINDLLSKPEEHATFVANCNIAAEQLCWEHEEQVLREIYAT